MANNINVKCNFATIFAKYDNIEDLRSLANNICGQVKAAFDTRVAEIKSGSSDVVVEVMDTVEALQSKTKGKSSKTAAAKEAAAKFKKQETATSQSKSKTTTVTESAGDTLVAITDTAAIKKLGLTFEKYNDRCWVLRGNTKPLRKVLKEQFKGVFNSRLTGGEGWVFKTATAQSVGDALGLKVKVA